MKRILNPLIVAVAIAFCSMAPKTIVAQDDQAPITLQTFYDELAPYGQWTNYPPYGYIFIPNAGPGFVPYETNGHWEYTEQYGWTWDSDLPWGWAAFHYGRWNYDQNYGWFWVPDLQWGPAWVVWRNSDQYYGWAPLPSGVDINVGINNGYGIPSNYWCFVPNQYMGDPYIYNYYMPRGNNDLYIMHSAVIMRFNYGNGHGYAFFAGPDRMEVERYRHAPIQPVVISFNSDPHHVYGAHEIGMYRPAHVVVVDHGSPAPVRAVRVEDVPRRNVPPAAHVNPAPRPVNHPVNNHQNNNRPVNNHGDDHHR